MERAPFFGHQYDLDWLLFVYHLHIEHTEFSNVARVVKGMSTVGHVQLLFLDGHKSSM